MSIVSLKAARFRNLQSVDLALGSGFNLLVGENASGKTSCLEALFYMGFGRSFRSTRPDHMVQHGNHDFLLLCDISRDSKSYRIGMQKQLGHPVAGRISGKPVTSLSEIAKLMPLQMVDQESFMLFSGPPRVRRQALDWGVFHVKHHYHDQWRRAKSALKQRNTLLKSGTIGGQLLRPWEHELVMAADAIDNARAAYVKALQSALEPMVADLFGNVSIRIAYHRGWPQGKRLERLLAESLNRDQLRGFTQYGPHRAELRFLCDGQDIAEVFSRGQQKLLVCAIKLAQEQLLVTLGDKQSTFLLDDLHAELDRENLGKVCQLLRNTGAQVIVTAINEEDFLPYLVADQVDRMFHVKHGDIQPAR